MKQNADNCPDCGDAGRRRFLKTAVGGLGAIAAAGALRDGGLMRPLMADEAKPTAETLVQAFAKTITEEQKKEMWFPFDHPLRSKVNNNWTIVKKTVQSFTKDQQQMIREIVNAVHSEEYAKRVMEQIEHDNDGDGGFGGCSVALFGEPGEPGKSKFEFVFTGRHTTRRCDGNSVEGAAFGGPIFYGHQAGDSFTEKADHPGNIYWYQGVRANEVFKALDGKQRELALRTDARPERADKTVEFSEKGKYHGIPMTELSKDQKELVRKVMGDVLAPFRKVDAEEALKLIEADGGFDLLHMAFYKNLDLGNDGTWDVWQIEGPSAIWYFRGHPHVHTWVHIRERKNA